MRPVARALVNAAVIDSEVVFVGDGGESDTVMVDVVSVVVGEVVVDVSVDESQRNSWGYCVGMVSVVDVLLLVGVVVAGVGGFACAAQSAGLCLCLGGMDVGVVVFGVVVFGAVVGEVVEVLVGFGAGVVASGTFSGDGRKNCAVVVAGPWCR